ncbi:MAG TPA: two-component regulator propeller domain-containing protein [Puia sp.]|nr:two-component regulator propeller domain-containing protein [Puia sp.]
MLYKTTASKILIAVFFFVLVNGCKSAEDVPFPADETAFPQPISNPFHFGGETKIKWTDSVANVKPTIKKFDFNKLPIKIFDSAGFVPFVKKPEEVAFDIDKLPDTAFDYNKLPSKTFRFETSILETPKLIKAGHPYLKTGTQDLIYEFGEPQGLLGTNITSFFQDSKGFMWIATDQALYRYDGENLLSYFNGGVEPGIYSMLEDGKGQIWLSTLNGHGIIVIDTKHSLLKRLTKTNGLKPGAIVYMLLDNEGRVWTTSFDHGLTIIDDAHHTLKFLDKTSGMQYNSIIGLAKDNDNNIWASTVGAGLNIIDLKKGKIRHLNKANGLNTDTLTGIIRDNMNRFCVPTINGEINIIDPQQKKILHYGQQQGLKKIVVVALLNDPKGNLWLCSGFGTNPGVGVEIINPEKGLTKILNTERGIAGNHINNIAQDKHGQVWIATTTGMNLLNRGGGDVEHVGKKNISTMSEDDYGQIWIGMYGGDPGVDILDTSTRMMKSFTKAQGLSNDSLQNIITEHGNMWVATNGGVDMIDSARKTITHFGKAEGLTTVNESNLVIDKKGRTWFGSNFTRAGFDQFDPSAKMIRHFFLEHGVNDTIVTDTRIDKKGQIWAATFTGGAYMIDPEKNTIKYLDDAEGLKEHYSKILLSDHKGNVWIGTGKGIYIVNANRDSVISFSSRNGLLSDDINSLNEYNGRVYAGSGAGLSIITPPDSPNEKWHVQTFGKAQGISKAIATYQSNTITKKGQFIWGDNGISILNYDGNKGKEVPPTHITGIDIFNQSQHFTNKQLTNLNEGDTLWSSKKDTFYLKGQRPVFASYGADKKIQWDSTTDVYNMPINLQLPYYQNYLQFHFTQMHLGSQDTVWYRYILQGIDKKWSDKTYSTFSQNYLNLPSGDYIFKVASMFNGNWSEPASFEFVISPPWWKTWWAYTLYVLGFSTLVWTLALYRSRKLKRENLLLEEKIALRTTQLQHSIEELKSTQTQLIQSEKMASLGELTAGIAHEIQNPLNFVNNFSEVNKELVDELQQELKAGRIDDAIAISNDIRDNEEKINHHGKRADAIVKGMLQHSRASTSVKEPTDINKLADEYLRLAYHGLRAKDKSFNAAMKTDFDEKIGSINIIPQDMGRVMLNLYTNAFYAVQEKQNQLAKNSSVLGSYEPTITVSTKKSGNQVFISVSDNGNGISKNIVDKIFQPFFTTKPTGQGTGLGLSLSYDIVKAHGGEIKVETKEKEGTTFMIVLPG